MTDHSLRKVAIVHDFFYWYGGADFVVKKLTQLFPNADVFVGFKHPKYNCWLPKEVNYTIVNKLPFKFILAPIYELLLPFAFENLDLQDYNLIISSSNIFAKGIVTKPSAIHLAYIHTTPRFLWGLTTSRQSKYKMFSPILLTINHFLRIWDYYSAQRPTILIANSKEVQRRIKKHYKRDSVIIHPPFDVKHSFSRKISRAKNLYITLGRLVKYKNLDIVVKYFSKHPKRELVIIGKGDQRDYLEKLTRDSTNIKFLGFISNKEKYEYLFKARALIHLSHEDFGIVSVEALACGTPVIGLNSGGTAEIIRDGKTGILLDKPTEQNLNNAINKFEKTQFDEKTLKNVATKYNTNNFNRRILNLIKQQEAKVKTLKKTPKCDIIDK